VSDEVVISLCPTGTAPRRAKAPRPARPAETAADVCRCHGAGGSTAHPHAGGGEGPPRSAEGSVCSPERAREVIGMPKADRR
jgi:uncharacterized protein (DUF849 family)